jgi:hypothetical protein
MSSNKFTKLSIYTASIMLVLSSCGMEGVSSGTDLSSKTPDMEVSCRTMLSDIDANEARAAKKYENKIIKISGYIDSIDEDLWGDPQINLSSGEQYSFTSCMLGGVDESTAVSLDKGKYVSFICNDFSEIIGSASLSNCS